MDSIIFVLIVFGFLSEIVLLYVNYLARVRYKKYFTEVNPTWKWFDNRGLTHLALFLGFLASIGLIIGGGFLASHALLGLLVGSIMTNAFFDVLTFKRRYICIKLKCDRVDEVAKCTKCELQDEYDVDIFSLGLNKKSEISWKQRYAHIIDFLKWIRDKILELMHTF